MNTTDIDGSSCKEETTLRVFTGMSEMSAVFLASSFLVPVFFFWLVFSVLFTSLLYPFSWGGPYPSSSSNTKSGTAKRNNMLLLSDTLVEPSPQSGLRPLITPIPTYNVSKIETWQIPCAVYRASIVHPIVPKEKKDTERSHGNRMVPPDFSQRRRASYRCDNRTM